MKIVGGLDVHRKQITFDYLDTDTGQVRRGRIVPADRERLREWLARFTGVAAAFAVEGCTGWRYVAEELARAGISAHLAEPAETADADARRRKRRAKTDRIDARTLRELLTEDRVPESWIPPEHVLEMRAKLELFKDLRDAHTAWVQRVHATWFHHGCPAISGNLLSAENRARLESSAHLSAAGRQTVTVGLRMLDHLDQELDALRREITSYARRQPGCRALTTQYGVGPLTAAALWCQLGDTRRFSASRQAVRHTGLDITVYSSDTRRAPGHLSRHGSPLLRWALFEAGKCAARPASPDHAYYQQVRERRGGNRAALSVGRKIARRSHHILRSLGDEALAAV